MSPETNTLFQTTQSTSTGSAPGSSETQILDILKTLVEFNIAQVLTMQEQQERQQVSFKEKMLMGAVAGLARTVSSDGAVKHSTPDLATSLSADLATLFGTVIEKSTPDQIREILILLSADQQVRFGELFREIRANVPSTSK